MVIATLRPLYPEQGDRYLLYRRLDGRRVGVDGYEDEVISCTYPGFEPQTVQPDALIEVEEK